ncbi:alginate O-acetyltransferase, partial [Pseudomonas syringae pv. actinidiae]|nr:alginate O-acetyltransferase [Pseudomonas syringae pv. actinidiae]
MTSNNTAHRSATKRLFKTCALAAGLGLMSLPAFAGDSALYGPTAHR